MGAGQESGHRTPATILHAEVSPEMAVRCALHSMLHLTCGGGSGRGRARGCVWGEAGAENHGFAMFKSFE